ncbi:MAG: hypothetical protein IJ865_00850, partial [Clostridia bacterium]|nr:hypothetical protein [Clostridia bacterium]
EAYALEEVRKLDEAYREENGEMDVTIRVGDRLEEAEEDISSTREANIGYVYVQFFLKQLQLRRFWEEAMEDRAGADKAYDVYRCLIYTRVLFPDEGRRMGNGMHRYVEGPKIDEEEIRRCMDLLAENGAAYLKHLYTHTANVVPLDSETRYYDCSGLQGLSEDPMGMFTDGQGIPLVMRINAARDDATGNRMPQKLKERVDEGPCIYCGDRMSPRHGMQNGDFVVSLSPKDLEGPLQEAILAVSEYYHVSDHSPVDLARLKSFDEMNDTDRELCRAHGYRVFPCGKLVQRGDNAQTQDLERKDAGQAAETDTEKRYLLVAFSGAQFAAQRKARQRETERPRAWLGHAADGLATDAERIAEKVRWDGYSVFATSLEIADREGNPNPDEVKHVLSILEGRSQIEETFRCMKTDVCEPSSVNETEKRRTAQLLLGYTALLIHRLMIILLESRLHQPVSIEPVLQTLRALQVSDCEHKVYIANYTYGRILSALDEITGILLNRKYYLPKQIERIIRSLI